MQALAERVAVGEVREKLFSSDAVLIGTINTLTSRQKEVLMQLLTGASNKNAARNLGIAEGTVKIHAAVLMKRFQVRNRTELAALLGNSVQVDRGAGSPVNICPRLSQRQAQVMMYLAQGLSTKEIACKVGIALGTVKIHIGRILLLVGVRNRTELAWLVALWTRHGCLPVCSKFLDDDLP